MQSDQTMRRVFRVKLLQKIIYFGFAGFLALIAVATPILERRDYPLQYQQSFYFMYFIVAVILIMALLIFLSPLVIIKLVVSPESIEYSDGFTRISVPWTQVERIGKHDFGLRSVEGLILKQPALTYTMWARPMGWFITLSFGKDFARFINVSLFEANWPAGVIGQEIRKYAPDLFGSIPDESGVEAEEFTADYRRISGWLILVGLWLVAVLLDSSFRLINLQLPTVLAGRWSSLFANESENVRNLTKVIIYLETIAGMAFTLASFALLVLFFLRKRIFRTQMLVFLAAAWLFTLVDFALLQLLLSWKGLEVGPPGPSLAFQIKNGMFAALFLYVAKSTRLKQTFTQ